MKHILGALTAFFIPFAAAAQGLPGGASALSETHGDWAVSCRGSENDITCSMSQRHVRDESRQLVLAIELHPQGPDAANGIILLPFGLRLADGVMLAIDEEAQIATLPFSTCLPSGCIVRISLETDTVAALREGDKLNIVTTADDGGEAVQLDVSLNGFTSALQRIAALRAN